jgi:hypothetical protein
MNRVKKKRSSKARQSHAHMQLAHIPVLEEKRKAESKAESKADEQAPTATRPSWSPHRRAESAASPAAM